MPGCFRCAPEGLGAELVAEFRVAGPCEYEREGRRGVGVGGIGYRAALEIYYAMIREYISSSYLDISFLAIAKELLK